jgi:glucokinase
VQQGETVLRDREDGDPIMRFDLLEEGQQPVARPHLVADRGVEDVDQDHRHACRDAGARRDGVGERVRGQHCRRRGGARREGRLHGEDADRLRLPALGEREVLLPEIRNRLSTLVVDDDIHLDEARAAAEHRRRGRLRLLQEEGKKDETDGPTHEREYTSRGDTFAAVSPEVPRAGFSGSIDGVARFVAGIDLGGTAINYTLLDTGTGEFLVSGLAEHPARAREGPEVCIGQIVAGLGVIADRYGLPLHDVVAAGLDTPGPASAAGVLSAKGSTNFAHAQWAGFDLRGGLERQLGIPVTYVNDGNAAALWGHMSLFGATPATSVSAIIGTGLGGGVVIDGRVVEGRNGFGGEVGHVLIPCGQIPELKGLRPPCNCGRIGDLESVCSLTAIERTLLPLLLADYPSHPLADVPVAQAAKQVRGYAERGDEMCRTIFRMQAHALGLFFDQMTNLLDPDAYLIGGGALEVSPEFQAWWLREVRAGMPPQREEQEPRIAIMPNGDAAGARGAALQARQVLDSAGPRTL